MLLLLLFGFPFFFIFAEKGHFETYVKKMVFLATVFYLAICGIFHCSAEIEVVYPTLENVLYHGTTATVIFHKPECPLDHLLTIEKSNGLEK